MSFSANSPLHPATPNTTNLHPGSSTNPGASRSAFSHHRHTSSMTSASLERRQEEGTARARTPTSTNRRASSRQRDELQPGSPTWSPPERDAPGSPTFTPMSPPLTNRAIPRLRAAPAPAPAAAAAAAAPVAAPSAPAVAPAPAPVPVPVRVRRAIPILALITPPRPLFPPSAHPRARSRRTSAQRREAARMRIRRWRDAVAEATPDADADQDLRPSKRARTHSPPHTDEPERETTAAADHADVDAQPEATGRQIGRPLGRQTLPPLGSLGLLNLGAAHRQGPRLPPIDMARQRGGGGYLATLPALAGLGLLVVEGAWDGEHAMLPTLAELGLQEVERWLDGEKAGVAWKKEEEEG